MASHLESILSESVDRLLSTGGVAVYLLEVLSALFLFVGVTTAINATVQWTLTEFGEELSADERAELEAVIAEELPLAIDALPGVGAALLIGAGLVASVLVLLVGLRTFGQNNATGIGPLDGFGWVFLNLIGAIIVYTILTTLGLIALLIGAFVVAVLLFYYFPAIVLGSHNMFSGLAESVSIVRDQPVPTFVLFVLLAGILIGLTVINMIVGFVLPVLVADILTILVVSIGYVAYYAVAARAYVQFSRNVR